MSQVNCAGLRNTPREESASALNARSEEVCRRLTAGLHEALANAPFGSKSPNEYLKSLIAELAPTPEKINRFPTGTAYPIEDLLPVTNFVLEKLREWSENAVYHGNPVPYKRLLNLLRELDLLQDPPRPAPSITNTP